MQTIILWRYKIHIKTSIKNQNNQKLLIKENKKKKEYKIKKYSYTNLITYLLNPADLKCQNLSSFKIK